VVCPVFSKPCPPHPPEDRARLQCVRLLRSARRCARLLPSCAAVLLSACATFSHTNEQLEGAKPTATTQDSAPPRAPVRATFVVDGNRGNERVLFFLALSGGGSRAAYLSAATMLKLQTLFADVDLLREVDVISSVSGGSLPAAYYAISRDLTLPLIGDLAPLLSSKNQMGEFPELRINTEAHTLHCDARLNIEKVARLRELVGTESRVSDRVVELCEQSQLDRLRRWDDSTVRELMKRNYELRWFLNWFWPDNIALYWSTAYDRSDIMAKTFEDNLYDTPRAGLPLNFSDLNPQRPFLIINATNATEQAIDDEVLPESFAFGSVFTFTEEDFRDRLDSRIDRYHIANAVMASSAFPLVFQNVTLRDYRPNSLSRCKTRTAPRDHACDPHYLHLFDGGNSDNMGLRSIKRTLFELEIAGKLDYDKIVVLLVDAFTKPVGAKRTDADPRALLSLLVDFNVLDAIDALLQANRAKIIGELQSGKLRWNEGDCRLDSQNLPTELCRNLDKKLGKNGHLDLSEKLVFYHFGFDDVKDDKLKGELDKIRTSFAISEADAEKIDRAVNWVLTSDNLCLQQIRAIARGETVSAQDARSICADFDILPK
jgi:predicted acylesterase/phospholipase RssA